jgi:outer membrane receptor protein involved in Fe transport
LRWAKFSLNTGIIQPLGNETSITYDGGVYRKLAKTLDIRISGDFVDTNNYWVADTSSRYYSKSSYTYTINSVKFYGFEGEFNWAPSEKFVLFGNYSFQNRSFKKDPTLPYSELLSLPPKNKGNLSLRYSLPLKMRMSFDLKAFGKRSSEGRYYLDRYALADISFDRKLPGGMTAGFFINNLFGMDYQQVFGYPAPGRVFGLRLKFNSAASNSSIKS